MRSKQVLDQFTTYCQAHPEERFWQALRSFSGKKQILALDEEPTAGLEDVPGRPWHPSNLLIRDTFYWEGINE